MSEVTIPQAISLAVQQHQAGRLVDAESIYQQVLSVDPENFDALHLLGVIAQQTQRSAQAVELISRAVALHPGVPEAHMNLASALRSLNRTREALQHFETTIRLRPNDVRANVLYA